MAGSVEWMLNWTAPAGRVIHGRVVSSVLWKVSDRGFVLSDHVDWPSLLAAVEGTGAERVWVTHGTREPLVRWLTERGLDPY